MPRRHPESPPTDRLAAVLGVPSPGQPGADPPASAGWVPQRRSLASVPAPSPRVGFGPTSSTSVVPSSLLSARVVPGTGRHRRPAPPGPAILTVPVALRGVRARPRRLAVLGVLVLLVTAALAFGARVAWARSLATPKPIAAAAHGPPGGLVTRTVPAAFAPTGLPSAATVLLAHVVGQVRHPGVVRLRPGARVLDAVKAAGGAMPSADLAHLNLARPVADGEQIVVPKAGETIPVAGASQSAGSGSTGAGSPGGLVDLNTADASTLDSLPGVGPVLSQRILDWRTAHGRFSSVDELGEVSGIGDKLFAQIAPKVKV